MSLNPNATFYPDLSEHARRDAALLIAQIDHTVEEWQQVILAEGGEQTAAEYAEGIGFTLKESVYRSLRLLLGPNGCAS